MRCLVPKSGFHIKVRLNLKIDSDLRDWVVEYAHRHGKTVTSVICECLQSVKIMEEKTQNEFVEQI
jgi:hypothetical protein